MFSRSHSPLEESVSRQVQTSQKQVEMECNRQQWLVEGCRVHTSLTFVWINDNTLHTSLSSYHTYSRFQDCLDIVWRWKGETKRIGVSDSSVIVGVFRRRERECVESLKTQRTMDQFLHISSHTSVRKDRLFHVLQFHLFPMKDICHLTQDLLDLLVRNRRVEQWQSLDHMFRLFRYLVVITPQYYHYQNMSVSYDC